MRKLNLPGTYWRGLAAQCAQKKTPAIVFANARDQKTIGICLYISTIFVAFPRTKTCYSIFFNTSIEKIAVFSQVPVINNVPHSQLEKNERTVLGMILTCSQYR